MVDTLPLASWNDGAAKSAILDFVARVTKEGGSEFAQPAERIAVFDNDGTLCCEQPLQIQFFFAFDRVKELAAKDPALAERQPFKAVLEHDYNTLFGLGLQALYELAFATHAGITDEEFEEVARGWLATAKHPKVGKLFKECVYGPQVELLTYLRENGFKTYIVSAGGADFMRAFVDEAYGIPREQVIGSSVKLRFDAGGDRVSLSKLSELNIFNDRETKPVSATVLSPGNCLLAGSLSTNNPELSAHLSTRTKPTAPTTTTKASPLGVSVQRPRAAAGVRPRSHDIR
jgi:phosphoglycolate phosphatase-like HAD superfamily hydrolase